MIGYLRRLINLNNKRVIANSLILYDQPMVALDFEFDSNKNIRQAGGVLFQGQDILDVFQSYLPCTAFVDQSIRSHSVLSFLNKMPVQKHIVEDLIGWIGDKPIVAHNAGVEKKLLFSAAARYGLTYNNNFFICTLDLSKKLFTGLESYQLSHIMASLNLPQQYIYHRAINDAYACFEVMMAIRKALATDYMLRPEYHYEFFEIISRLPKKQVIDLLSNYKGHELLTEARKLNIPNKSECSHSSDHSITTYKSIN